MFDANNHIPGNAPDGYSLYDASGNLRYDQTTGNYLRYDAENRLIGVGSGISYVYNGAGQRVAGGPPGAPIHRNSKAGWPIRPSVGRVGLFVSDLAPGSPYPPSLSLPAATLPLADNRLLVPRRYPIPAVVLGDDVLPALRARLRQELYIGVGLNSLNCFDTEVSLA